MNRHKNIIDTLLPVLRCPTCTVTETLKVKEGFSGKNWYTIPLHHTYLFCKNCGTQYPFSEDSIPLIFPGATNTIYGYEHIDAIQSNLNRNISMYDRFSDDYNVHTRKSDLIKERVQNAVKVLAYYSKKSKNIRRNVEPLLHLDYGCGPGHVLKWTKSFGFRQIGLDVSLHNLRNAREQTGCIVVCGDACFMPFSDGAFDIVTESSVLHHILEWRAAVDESIRVCGKEGGVLIDSEPSAESMAWSRVAMIVFATRFTVYPILSYLLKEKTRFRNSGLAKEYYSSNVHNQPGKGLPMDELTNRFSQTGMFSVIIPSPTIKLTSLAHPNWKSIILNLLSLKNPWNPLYGQFTLLAHRTPITLSEVPL